jgi:hypothetical protein
MQWFNVPKGGRRRKRVAAISPHELDDRRGRKVRKVEMVLIFALPL